MKLKAVQRKMLVSLALTLAVISGWSLFALSRTQAQGDDKNDAICRQLFPDIYSRSDLGEDDIFCINTTADGIDFTADQNNFDGRCDSDAATDGQQCTLRAAVMEANAPPASDLDFILVPPGRYRITLPNSDTNPFEDSGRTGDIDIISAVHILGSRTEEVTIDANLLDRAFQVRYSPQADFEVFISRMTIINGQVPGTGDGGNILNTGRLTLDDVIIEDYNDAGIYNILNEAEGYVGILNIYNSAIRGAGEERESRGLYVLGGGVTLSNTLITNNYISQSFPRSERDGAGIYIKITLANPAARVVLEDNSRIVNNTTIANGSKGGGVYMERSGSIARENIQVIINNSTLDRNQSQDGGGLYTDDAGVVTINGSTISRNIARDADNGDGLNNKGQLVSGRGGGIYHDSPLEMQIVNSTVSSNRGNSHGGGIFVDGAPNASQVREVVLTSTTVYANVANSDAGDVGDGGGIYLQLFIDGKGRLYIDRTGRAFLQNTILAGNLDNSIADFDKYRDCSQCEGAVCVHAFHSSGHNLVGHNFGCRVGVEFDDVITPTNTFTASTRLEKTDAELLNPPNNPYINPNPNGDWVGSRREQDDTLNLTGPIDPQLLPLRDNGGGVETHALSTSDEPTNPEKRSFVIDNGDCPGLGIDQRAAPRPQNGDNTGGSECDIGAYEVMPNDISVYMTASAERVSSNQTLIYVIDYVNQGTFEATSINLTALMPAILQNVSFSHSSPDGVTISQQGSQNYRWSLSNLKPGYGGRITITGLIDPNLTTLQIINTQAEIDGAENDDKEDNNTSQVQVVAIPGADLAIGLAPERNPAPVKQPLSYTVWITNTGPAIATDIEVTNVLPTGTTFKSASPGCTHDSSTKTVTCLVAFLGINASTSLFIQLQTPSDPVIMTNEVAVISELPDPDESNNTAQVTTEIKPDVDVFIEVTTDPITGTTGELLTYKVTAGNNGPQNAEVVTVRNEWPAGTNLQNVDNGDFSCQINQADRNVICTLQTLRTGNRNKKSFEIDVEPLFPGVIENKAWIETGSADSDATNNFTSTLTTISGDGPTATPTGTATPTTNPNATPTNTPTTDPNSPTNTPTHTPTTDPNATPTNTPTATHTPTATASPTNTATPTNTPTSEPPTTGIVDDFGGEVCWQDEASERAVCANFPANAVPRPHEVEIIIQGGPAAGCQLPSENSHFANRAFSVTATDQFFGEVRETFDEPFILKIVYKDDDYQQLTRDETQLNVYYCNQDNEWVAAYDSTCAKCSHKHDLPSNTFEIGLMHLTEFALFAEVETNELYLPLILKR